MSSEDVPDNGAEQPQGADAEPDNNSLALKLSKELSNWRRKRGAGRPRRFDGSGGSSFQSEPARTIKVRGHETLVVRKPKLAGKTPPAPTPEPSE